MVASVGLAAALAWPLRGLAASPSKVTISVYLREWPLELEWENRMIELFEKENPDIDVEVIKDAGQYHDKLNLLWSTGNPPDVWDHGGRVLEYHVRGWLLDLTPYINRDSRELDVADFFPAAWKAYQIGGKHIAMPFMIAPGTFFFINRDLFEQAGLPIPSPDWDDPTFTWEGMIASARKLTRLTGDGRAEQFGVDPAEAMAYAGLGIQYLFGGDRYDKDSYATGIPQKPTMKTVENIRAFTEYLRVLYEERVAPGGSTPWARAIQGWPFLEQKVAMFWAAGGYHLNNLVKMDVGFRWTLAPLPRTEAGRTNIVYTDPWMISSKTKHPEAAWRFVKFITGKRAMEEYVRQLGFMPARSSAARLYIDNVAHKSGMSAAEVVTALSGAQKYGREAIDHIMFGVPDTERQLSEILAPMLRRRVSTEAALENADRVLTQVFAELRKQALQ